jgi:hypothetical protein
MVVDLAVASTDRALELSQSLGNAFCVLVRALVDACGFNVGYFILLLLHT